jgi:hypothetical protein
MEIVKCVYCESIHIVVMISHKDRGQLSSMHVDEELLFIGASAQHLLRK